jgi:filamentous hemagglutinin
MNFQGVQVNTDERINLMAGSNINISNVTDISKSDATADNSRGYKRVMNNDETVIGTSLNANGNINIQTSGSLTISGSDIVSDKGKIDLSANDGIQIQNVTEKHESLVESKTTKSGFFSKKTTFKRDYSLVNEVVGSTISGDEVNISSGADITVKGSNIVADNDLTLSANKDINIISADETGAKEHYSYTKTSGLFSGGGLGFTIGSKSEKLTVTEKSLGEVGSVIGSIKGDVNVNAGDKVNSIGTAFESGQDLNIIGKTVNIENSIDTVDQNTKYEFKQTGISVSLGGKILNSAMGVVNDVERSGQVADERLQALYVYKASQDLKKLKGVDSFDDVKKDTKVSISIGSSQTTSEQNVHTETVNESNIKAGNAVNIVATGDDVNIAGTKITAPDINIEAVRDINLDAAQNKQQTDSKTSSSSWSVGVELNGGLFANANTGKGKENGTVVTNSETVIKATDTVNLVSGNDTNINGSKVEGGKVIANIGGDLNIASLQDIDNYNSKNSSSGIGLSTDGVTGSVSQGKTNSTYESVVDQAGIYAGKDGFDIKVGGNTDLKGAVIASEATLDKNKLSTDTLTYSDIQNKAEYEASSIGVNLDTRKTAEKKDAGLTPDIGVKVSGDGDSTTKSAISPGTVEIRSNPNQDISDLSRDPASAINALGKIFDKKTVQEQQELAKVFSEEAFKIVGDIAQKQQEKADIVGALAKSYQTAAEKARSEGDIEKAQKYEALAGQMKDMESQLAPWRDGGAYKIAMHGLVGGLAASMGGGDFASGATGAGASEATYTLLKKLPPDLQQWGSAIVGAAAANVADGTAQTGAATGSAGTANNGLTHIAGGVLDGVIDSLKKDGKGLWDTFTDPVAAAVEIKDAGKALYNLGTEQGFGAIFKELGTALSGDCLNKYNTIQNDFVNGNIDEDTRDYRLGVLAGEVTYLIVTTVPAPEKLAINPTLASRFEKISALVKNERGSVRLPDWSGNTNHQLVDKMKDLAAKHPNYDCSEIAEDLFRAAGNEGEIINITSNTKYGQIKAVQDGSTIEFDYHQVYSDGKFIYDPRYNNTPILKDDYLKMINELNDGNVVFDVIR